MFELDIESFRERAKRMSVKRLTYLLNDSVQRLEAKPQAYSAWYHRRRVNCCAMELARRSKQQHTSRSSSVAERSTPTHPV